MHYCWGWLGPYYTLDECYDRALDMVEDIKKILNVEAEYSYKCEHETGIWFGRSKKNYLSSVQELSTIILSFEESLK